MMDTLPVNRLTGQPPKDCAKGHYPSLAGTRPSHTETPLVWVAVKTVRLVSSLHPPQTLSAPTPKHCTLTLIQLCTLHTHANVGEGIARRPGGWRMRREIGVVYSLCSQTLPSSHCLGLEENCTPPQSTSCKFAYSLGSTSVNALVANNSTTSTRCKW